MEILGLLDELRTMACNGLTYATNPYDRERYERLLHLTSQSYAEMLDLPSEQIREQLRAETVYITPKVGTDAAIFDDEGRIAIHQRSQNEHKINRGSPAHRHWRHCYREQHLFAATQPTG
jgi:hypothetical protein